MTNLRTIELEALKGSNPEIWMVADETQTIKLSVGVDGSLESLVISANWWRTVRPEEFGAVVLRLRAMSAASRADSIRELTVASDPVEPAAAPLAASGDNLSHLSVRLGNLVAAFGELEHYRRAVNESAVLSSTLQSESGNVRMEISGGAPRSLTVDSYNLQFTPVDTLAREVIELFRRAKNWLAERQADAMQEFPHLREIRSARSVS